MDYGKAALVVFLTLVIVVAFNAMIFATYKDGGKWISMISKATKQARNPWKEEDQDLEELSRLVQPYRPEPPDEPQGEADAS